jgi:hypothetical protein
LFKSQLELQATCVIHFHWFALFVSAPRLSTFSPFYLAAGNVDYSMTAPLFADGSNFPCKAYPAGVITGTLTAGTTLTVSIVGTANHNGGHCQFAVSYDNGQTWVVLLTVIHNCLGGASMNDPFLFNVPIPVGVPGCQSCVFAWSWVCLPLIDPEYIGIFLIVDGVLSRSMRWATVSTT